MGFSQVLGRSGLAFSSAEKDGTGTTAEALRSGDAGCGVGEYGNGMVSDGAKAGTGDLTATNNSPAVSYGNIGPDFNKTGLGANKRPKEQYLTSETDDMHNKFR